ncbi:coiled-coil domain-containing protein 122-like [Mugil cephalus]|uniref:coiled-coil domain-containing protein 122-like n=1 Tax=Mugil cephalus TaxID=48193 RepID=UPI001FB75251|nr:coiled-coil domain-containing protein 122-like [Mugil cephalus]
MSNTIEDGFGGHAGFSLTKAVEDVSQHGYAQTEALKEKQRTLSSMQAKLSDVEKKVEMAEQGLRSKVREIITLEDETEHMERRAKLRRDRCASIRERSAELRILASEEEEAAAVALARFSAYRGKMERHRAAASHAASQTEARKELEEKKELVRMLRRKKEELREDLDDPNGNAVQAAKREIDALKEQICAKRKVVAERREQLRKESEGHAQIKKEIEIQNKRYEAIIKRLCCQLSRAQAVHRQMSEDICRMKRHLAELQR